MRCKNFNRQILDVWTYGFYSSNKYVGGLNKYLTFFYCKPVKINLVNSNISKIDFVLISDESAMHECLASLIHEQHELSLDAASSALSITRLQQRIIVLERFLIAMSRYAPAHEHRSPSRKKQHAQANINKRKRSLSVVCGHNVIIPRENEGI